MPEAETDHKDGGHLEACFRGALLTTGLQTWLANALLSRLVRANMMSVLPNSDSRQTHAEPAATSAGQR